MSKKSSAPKDPFVFKTGRQCEYCANEPAAIALIQCPPDKPTQVYLCDYHRFAQLPVGFTKLQEFKIGRSE